MGPSPTLVIASFLWLALGTRAPWQGEQQRWVTSIDPFKRLPLCALIANRAAAPEVTIVSLYLPLPEPWTRL